MSITRRTILAGSAALVITYALCRRAALGNDSIGYNITAGGNGLFTPSFTDTIIQGLSVGGELQF